MEGGAARRASDCGKLGPLIGAACEAAGDILTVQGNRESNKVQCTDCKSELTFMMEERSLLLSGGPPPPKAPPKAAPKPASKTEGA